MSLVRFGQYAGEVPDLTIGSELGLDGNDGFDDQSLWEYRKGDMLTFIINPSRELSILNHEIIQVEILKDTGHNDFAYTKIISFDVVDNFFHKKPVILDNDFLELVEYYTWI